MRRAALSVTAPVQRANHGSHFRADRLRGTAKLIDPFIGVDFAWMSEIGCRNAIELPPRLKVRHIIATT